MWILIVSKWRVYFRGSKGSCMQIEIALGISLMRLELLRESDWKTSSGKCIAKKDREIMETMKSFF